MLLFSYVVNFPPTTRRWIIVPVAVGLGLAWAGCVAWVARNNRRVKPKPVVVDAAGKPIIELTKGDWVGVSVIMGVFPPMFFLVLAQAWHPLGYVEQVLGIAWVVCLVCVMLLAFIFPAKKSAPEVGTAAPTVRTAAPVVQSDATSERGGWRSVVAWFGYVLGIGVITASIKMGTPIGYLVAGAVLIFFWHLEIGDLCKALAKRVRRRKA